MTTPTIRIETSEISPVLTKDKASQAKEKLQEFEKKVRLAKKALKHVDAAQTKRIGKWSYSNDRFKNLWAGQKENTNPTQPRTMNNNNSDDSVEEIESSQRVSQFYEMPADDSLNETIPFNTAASERSVEEKDEAFDALFELVISPEDHCVICNASTAGLTAPVSIGGNMNDIYDFLINFVFAGTRVARQQLYRHPRDERSWQREIFVYYLQQRPDEI